MALIKKHFNSVEQFAQAVKNAADEERSRNRATYGLNDIDYTYAGHKAIVGVQTLMAGDRTGIDLVEEYMKTVTQSIPTLARVWKSDVAGFFPNIPAYLAGEPESMWRFDSDYSDNTPVRIWVNCLPSGGNSTEEIYMRGAAITALAMVLAQRRTMVRISPYSDLANEDSRDGALASYDLPNPLIMSQVIAALANENASRNAFVTLCRNMNPRQTGGWLRGHCPRKFYSDAQCKEDLGAGPDDIVVPAAYLGDEIVSDPIAWVNRAIKPYLDQEV